MTKYEFLGELDKLLSGLEESERREILEDYEEHFAFARRAQKSDAEVISMIGTPKAIADEIVGVISQGDTALSTNEEMRKKEEELKAKAEALEAQAEALEEKLASQAEALASQAEALAEQADALNRQPEQSETTFSSHVGNFVDSIAGAAQSVAQTVVGAINESFEMDTEDIPEHAKTSETTIEEIIDMTGIKNVVIDAQNQKINIKKTTKQKSLVRISRGMLAVKVENDTLYIQSRALRRKITVGSIFVYEDTSNALEIKLPEAVYQLIQGKSTNGRIEIDSFIADELNLETCNGRIEASNIVGKDVRLKTLNGRVKLANVTGAINARTVNGKVTCENITGAVVASSTNGKVELENITGNIDATTTNGKIEFENEAINQEVFLKTSNAKIEVTLNTLPTNAKFELSTTNAKTKLFETERNYDIFGEGLHTVKLHTTNAKIEVNQKSEN